MTPLPPRCDLDQMLAQRPRMTALARRLLADEHGAEDVVQEAWVTALERPPRESGALGSWLSEVVRTLALKRLRGERRLQARERKAAKPEGPLGDEDVAERLATQCAVLDAVLALDAPLRGAIHARYFDDLPPREIARRQGISIHTVNDRLKRARATLRDDLERRLNGPLSGDERSVWSLALLPLADLSPRATQLLAANLAGGVTAGVGGATAAGWTASQALIGKLMLMKKTLTAAALALAVAGGLWWIGPGLGAHQPTGAGTPQVPVEALLAEGETEDVRDVGGGADAQRVVAETAAYMAAAGPRDWIVRGRAQLGSKGPAAGVQVRARLWLGYDTHVAPALDETLTSDGEGALEWFLTVPTSGVTITWSPVDKLAPSYAGPSQIVPPDEGAPQELVVTFYPLDSTVTGVVRDQGGEPIVGAEVTASTSATTDEQGRYLVQASSYRYEELVRALAPGLTTRSTAVEIPGPGARVTFDMTLQPAFQISGRVVNESEMPVEGAVVTAFTHDTRTDDQGEFLLDHLDPGQYSQTVMVTKEGYAPLTEFVPPGTGATVVREFVLDRGVRLRGKLVDARGEAVSGAQVRLGRSVGIANARWAVSDDDGSFLIECSPRGERTLWVSHPGFAPHRRDVQIPQRGDRAPDVTIVLERGRSIAGRVVDSAGNGLTEVLVQPRRKNAMGGSKCKTAEDGAFILEHIPDDGIQLWLYKSGWERVKRDVLPGEVTGLRIVMQSSGVVGGRVIDAASGAAVENFRVRLHYIGDPGEPRYDLYASWTREGVAFSDPEGRWQTSDLPLPIGRFVGIEIRAEGYAPSSLTSATITAEVDHDSLVIPLSGGQRVTGRVIDAATRAAVAGARVSYRLDPGRASEAIGRMLYLDPGSQFLTRTDAAGDFKFENVAPGRISFKVEHDTYDRAVRSGPHEVEAHGAAADFLIELGGASAITGIVLDEDGSPASGAEVVLVGIEVSGISGSSVWKTTAEADGRFVFSGLREGYYSVGRPLGTTLHEYDDALIAYGLGVLLRGAPSADVVLEPQGTASLVGTLVADGDVPARVELRFGIVPEAPPKTFPFVHPTFAAIAEEGSFRVDGLPAGTFRLEPRWYEGREQRRGQPVEIEIEAGRELRREIRLILR